MNTSYGTPSEVTDVPTNSVASVGEVGSAKSCLRSVTQNEWMVHRGVQKIHPIGALVWLEPRKRGLPASNG